MYNTYMYIYNIVSHKWYKAYAVKTNYVYRIAAEKTNRVCRDDRYSVNVARFAKLISFRRYNVDRSRDGYSALLVSRVHALFGTSGRVARCKPAIARAASVRKSANRGLSQRLFSRERPLNTIAPPRRGSRDSQDCRSQCSSELRL